MHSTAKEIGTIDLKERGVKNALEAITSNRDTDAREEMRRYQEKRFGAASRNGDINHRAHIINQRTSIVVTSQSVVGEINYESEIRFLVKKFHEKITNAGLVTDSSIKLSVEYDCEGEWGGTDNWHTDPPFVICILSLNRRRFNFIEGDIEIDADDPNLMRGGVTNLSGDARVFQPNFTLNRLAEPALMQGSARAICTVPGSIYHCNFTSFHRRGEFEQEGWRVVLRATI